MGTYQVVFNPVCHITFHRTCYVRLLTSKRVAEKATDIHIYLPDPLDQHLIVSEINGDSNKGNARYSGTSTTSMELSLVD
ncbi:unnamed protein product [Sphenostylis stenocarpa]|uniref:Uncharacterized protein n=1 Tax=Sphenostylis stenocarpa TaxID=92480 RepID=A0AA86SKJ3_9FABA|nr:unnamed protein product [Sphenostylis stenocarpa]